MNCVKPQGLTGVRSLTRDDKQNLKLFHSLKKKRERKKLTAGKSATTVV